MEPPAHSTHPAWTNALGRAVPSLLVVLAGVGLAMLGLNVLFSVSRDGAELYALKQAAFLAVAGVAAMAAFWVDPERLRPHVWWIFGASVVLLLAVLVPGIGREVNGARRWLVFGPLSLQVSDPAKLGLLLVLSHWLASQQRRLADPVRGFLVPCGLIGVVAALVMKQPDFGTTFLIAGVGFTLLFLAGGRLRYLLPTVAVGLAGFAFLVWRDPVRMRRIISFLDPENNRADSAFQLWQGILAFGSGGAQGVGLGNGRQQLAYLPFAHTDFIFPIIGEELGLLATLSVAGTFLLIFVLGLSQLRHAPTQFQFLVATGALLFIVLQSLINMGVVTGLLPTKGMSLPFISYGGSNLLVNFTLLGFLAGCFWRWNHPVTPRPLDL